MEDYEFLKKLGSGNFGVISLMRHRVTGEMVAVKRLERGPKIDKNVYREVINHRKLSHPNVIGFKAVRIDARYLYILMEYGAGARLLPRTGCALAPRAADACIGTATTYREQSVRLVDGEGPARGSARDATLGCVRVACPCLAAVRARPSQAGCFDRRAAPPIVTAAAVKAQETSILCLCRSSSLFPALLHAAIV